MQTRFLIPVLALATLAVLSSPVAASLLLTGVSFAPDAPLVPGTSQHVVVTFNALPAGSTTFIRGHELQMQTNLSDARWSIQVIDDGNNAALQSASGNVAFVTGALLSYPTSHDVSLSVTIDGTVPPSATSPFTVLTVEELDNEGAIVPGSTITVNQPVAGQSPLATSSAVPTLTAPVMSSAPVPTQSGGFAPVTGILAFCAVLLLVAAHRRK
jgi:hypothetical protein